MIRYCFTAILAGLLLSGCARQPGETLAEPAAIIQTAVAIEGMTCEGCVKGITQRLSALPGVSGVQISLEEKRGVITHDPARVSAGKIIETISVGNWKASPLSEPEPPSPSPSETTPKENS